MIYADIVTSATAGSIARQVFLDDDRVEYAEIKHTTGGGDSKNRVPREEYPSKQNVIHKIVTTHTCFKHTIVCFVYTCLFGSSRSMIVHDCDCTVHCQPLNLDTLLIALHSQATPKWYQFGLALGVQEDILKRCAQCSDEEAIVEMLDHWLRAEHAPKLTWEDVGRALSDIGLQQLGEEIIA